jgi:hypothetical protein
MRNSCQLSVIGRQFKIFLRKIFGKFGFCLLFSVLCSLFSVLYTGYGQVIALKEVLNSPNKFDGKSVEVEGEVIGELIRENEAGWINILSQGNNIGVFLPLKEYSKVIKYWGGYKQQGDSLRLRCVFHQNCSLHNEIDMHLESLEVIQRGFVKEEVIPPFKIKLAINCFIICLMSVAVYFIKLRYRRKRYGTRS